MVFIICLIASRQSPSIVAIMQYLFNVILQTDRKIRGDLRQVLFISYQVADLTVIHKRIIAGSIFARIVVAYFNITNAFADLAASTCSINIEFWESIPEC